MNATLELTAPSNALDVAPSLPRAEESDGGKRRVSLPTSADGKEARAGSPPRRASRLPLILALTVAAALGAFGGYRWWVHALAWVKTDNAYLAAHIHQVSSRVAGTIQEVLVKEHQEVIAGQPLARLDRRDFEVRLQQAEAQLAQSKAQSSQATAKIAQAEAEVARETAHANKARQDLERARRLDQSETKVISRQELDAAQAEAEAAEAALRAAESALVSAKAGAEAAAAQLRVAEADVENAQLQMSYTEILAPADGRIGRKNLEVGNRVLPGQPLLALVDPDVWLVANVKETQLEKLKPGQLAQVVLDAFPGRIFAGRVESFAPASGAQFALLPPDNATGNFTRIVQRVPVKIVFDRGSIAGCADRIVPGMSAMVEIKVK